MAQTITCDTHGGAHPADWLVTNLGDGNTAGYCAAAYAELMVAAAEAIADAEAALAANDAITRLGGRPTSGIAGAGDEAGESSDAPAPDEPAPPAIEPAHTVHRGRSRKARAARARQAATSPTTVLTGNVASAGPDDDEDDDEDELASAKQSEAERLAAWSEPLRGI